MTCTMEALDTSVQMMDAGDGSPPATLTVSMCQQMDEEQSTVEDYSEICSTKCDITPIETEIIETEIVAETEVEYIHTKVVDEQGTEMLLVRQVEHHSRESGVGMPTSLPSLGNTTQTKVVDEHGTEMLLVSQVEHHPTEVCDSIPTTLSSLGRPPDDSGLSSGSLDNCMPSDGILDGSASDDPLDVSEVVEVEVKSMHPQSNDPSLIQTAHHEDDSFGAAGLDPPYGRLENYGALETHASITMEDSTFPYTGYSQGAQGNVVVERIEYEVPVIKKENIEPEERVMRDEDSVDEEELMYDYPESGLSSPEPSGYEKSNPVPSNNVIYNPPPKSEVSKKKPRKRKPKTDGTSVTSNRRQSSKKVKQAVRDKVMVNMSQKGEQFSSVKSDIDSSFPETGDLPMDLSKHVSHDAGAFPYLQQLATAASVLDGSPEHVGATLTPPEKIKKNRRKTNELNEMSPRAYYKDSPARVISSGMDLDNTISSVAAGFMVYTSSEDMDNIIDFVARGERISTPTRFDEVFPLFEEPEMEKTMVIKHEHDNREDDRRNVESLRPPVQSPLSAVAPSVSSHSAIPSMGTLMASVTEGRVVSLAEMHLDETIAAVAGIPNASPPWMPMDVVDTATPTPKRSRRRNADGTLKPRRKKPNLSPADNQVSVPDDKFATNLPPPPPGTVVPSMGSLLASAEQSVRDLVAKLSYPEQGALCSLSPSQMSLSESLTSSSIAAAGLLALATAPTYNMPPQPNSETQHQSQSCPLVPSEAEASMSPSHLHPAYLPPPLSEPQAPAPAPTVNIKPEPLPQPQQPHDQAQHMQPMQIPYTQHHLMHTNPYLVPAHVRTEKAPPHMSIQPTAEVVPPPPTPPHPLPHPQMLPPPVQAPPSQPQQVMESLRPSISHAPMTAGSMSEKLTPLLNVPNVHTANSSEPTLAVTLPVSASNYRQHSPSDLISPVSNQEFSQTKVTQAITALLSTSTTIQQKHPTMSGLLTTPPKVVLNVPTPDKLQKLPPFETLSQSAPLSNNASGQSQPLPVATEHSELAAPTVEQEIVLPHTAVVHEMDHREQQSYPAPPMAASPLSQPPPQLPEHPQVSIVNYANSIAAPNSIAPAPLYANPGNSVAPAMLPQLFFPAHVHPSPFGMLPPGYVSFMESCEMAESNMSSGLPSPQKAPLPLLTKRAQITSPPPAITVGPPPPPPPPLPNLEPTQVLGRQQNITERQITHREMETSEGNHTPASYPTKTKPEYMIEKPTDPTDHGSKMTVRELVNARIEHAVETSMEYQAAQWVMEAPPPRPCSQPEQQEDPKLSYEEFQKLAASQALQQAKPRPPKKPRRKKKKIANGLLESPVELPMPLQPESCSGKTVTDLLCASEILRQSEEQNTPLPACPVIVPQPQPLEGDTGLHSVPSVRQYPVGTHQGVPPSLSHEVPQLLQLVAAPREALYQHLAQRQHPTSSVARAAQPLTAPTSQHNATHLPPAPAKHYVTAVSEAPVHCLPAVPHPAFGTQYMKPIASPVQIPVDLQQHPVVMMTSPIVTPQHPIVSMHHQIVAKNTEATAQHPECVIQHPTAGMQHLPPGAFQHLPGGMHHPPGALQHPSGGIQHPSGAFQHPSGAFQPPPGAMQHPPGGIKHPPGGIRHPPGAIQHTSAVTLHPSAAIASMSQHPAPVVYQHSATGFPNHTAAAPTVPATTFPHSIHLPAIPTPTHVTQALMAEVAGLPTTVGVSAKNFHGSSPVFPQVSCSSQHPAPSAAPPVTGSHTIVPNLLPGADTLADRYMKNWQPTGKYCCMFCNYSSVTQKYLFRHWLKHHNDLCVYKCMYCDECFSHSPDGIKRHQTATHQDKPRQIEVNHALYSQAISVFEGLFRMPYYQGEKMSEHYIFTDGGKSQGKEWPARGLPPPMPLARPLPEAMQHNIQMAPIMTDAHKIDSQISVVAASKPGSEGRSANPPEEGENSQDESFTLFLESADEESDIEPQLETSNDPGNSLEESEPIGQYSPKRAAKDEKCENLQPHINKPEKTVFTQPRIDQTQTFIDTSEVKHRLSQHESSDTNVEGQVSRVEVINDMSAERFLKCDHALSQVITNRRGQDKLASQVGRETDHKSLRDVVAESKQVDETISKTSYVLSKSEEIYKEEKVTVPTNAITGSEIERQSLPMVDLPASRLEHNPEPKMLQLREEKNNSTQSIAAETT